VLSIYLSLRRGEAGAGWGLWALSFGVDAALMFSKPTYLLFPLSIYALSLFTLPRALKWKAVSGVVFCGLLVGAWMWGVQSQGGYFEVSRVGRVNRLGRALIYGDLQPDFCERHLCSSPTQAAIQVYFDKPTVRNSPSALMGEVLQKNPEWTRNQLLDVYAAELAAPLRWQVLSHAPKRFVKNLWSRAGYSQTALLGPAKELWRTVFALGIGLIAGTLALASLVPKNLG